MKIDLHGLTVHGGWKLYCKMTQLCYNGGKKTLTVITGQGQMNTEIMGWVSADQYAKSAKKLNEGAWQIEIVSKKKEDKKRSVTDPGYKCSDDVTPLQLEKLHRKFNGGK